MPWNDKYTQFEGTATELLMGAESAQDIEVPIYDIYNQDYYISNNALLTDELLADHIARAILCNSPEWLLTIRWAIRRELENHLLDAHPRWIRAREALLAVIQAFIKHMNIATLT